MTGTAEWIGECAYNALIEEVNTTPKPGLVDLYSNGAHTDMDAETFRRSAEALRPFFVQMAREGLSFDGSAEELFMGLRSVGMDAEQAMYAATGGVNTHKGAIFTFGIFCAGAGRCLKEQRELTALGLLEMEQEMTVRVLTAELEKLRGKISAAGQATHGERNLHRYG
ncbi:MAG: triphosphoribosyl-dephospho-CoA synthase, partial [Lachnospiraceae bacterium]|nr:triphosphoribosyl-dephospho-CoA synthase [Lachnospiraceae bacterium]